MLSHTLKHPWLLFFALACGSMISPLDGSIMNVALPTLSQEFSAPLIQVQWIASAYFLLLCVTLPLMGRISDIYSRRRIYLSGFIAFSISSLLCGLSHRLDWLIFFRCLQGASGAMLIANNGAIVMAYFPKKMQAQVLGLLASASAIGTFLGPGVGGILLHFLSWHWLFYINLPIGIFGFTIGWLRLPHDKHTHHVPIDFSGAFLFVLAIGGLLLFTDQLTTFHPLGHAVWLLLALSCLAFFLFWRRETHFPYPMMHFALFKNRVYLLTLYQGFLAFVLIACNNILLPFYLAIQLQLSNISIGMVMLASPLLQMVLTPVAGYVTDKINTRHLTLFGLLTMCLGLGFQSQLTAHSALTHVYFDQLLIGLGFVFFQTPNNYLLMNALEKSQMGSGSSIGSLTRTLGRIAGITLATLIFTLVSAHFPHLSKTLRFTRAFQFTLLFIVVLIILATLASRFLLSDHPPTGTHHAR